MMRLHTVLVLAACATALVSASAGPHIRRWSASAVSVDMEDSSGPTHIVAYFDEPAKRSLMHMDWPEQNEMFGNAMSIICKGTAFYFFNATACFELDAGESCFVNPMDFRGAEQGTCGNEGQQLWSHPRGAHVCLDRHNVAKKLGLVSEGSLEVDTFRWFKPTVSTQQSFWAPPAYCANAQKTRLLDSAAAPNTKTLGGLARDITRMTRFLK